jgi:hypothetical protein
MTSLELVKLRELMKLTSGRPEIAVAMVDGPIAVGHTDLARTSIRDVSADTRLSARKLTAPLVFTGLSLRAF